MTYRRNHECRPTNELGACRKQGAASDSVPNASRRDFLRAAGETGSLTVAASLGLGGLLTAPAEAKGKKPGVGALRPNRRRIDTFQIRIEAARSHLLATYPRQRDNGDERRYPDKRASFFKCLPQDDLGEVDRRAYAGLLRALRTGEPADFEAIPLAYEAGGRLANPQAAYAFDLKSRDLWVAELAYKGMPQLCRGVVARECGASLVLPDVG